MMKGGGLAGACLRALGALLVLTCVVGCVGPGGAVGLSKPRLALYRCLLNKKGLIEFTRSLPRGTGPSFVPWGLVWLEKEGLFGAGRYINRFDTELLEEVGTPMPPEKRELVLTRAEAARYYQLLLDGHTLETMAKEMNFPDMSFLFTVRWFQAYFFLTYSAQHRALVGREILRALVDAAKAHRGKPGWVEWRRELSRLAPELVAELAHVPVESWPEWYRQNGKRLYWNPATEMYDLQLEVR